MNKIAMYIKQVFLLAVGNKLRFVLTFIGMFVGLLIFTLGNLVLESYYYGRLKEIREFPEQAAFVLLESQEENMSEKLRDGKIYPEAIRIPVSSYVIYEHYDKDNNGRIVYANITGVTNASDLTLIDTVDGIKPVPVKIKSGRNLSYEEIKSNEKVCIIDEYTANILFGDDTAIGRKIQFNEYTGGIVAVGEEENKAEPVSYEIVGVMENTYYSEKRNIKQDTGYEYSNGKDTIDEHIYVNIICPYEYYKNLGEDEGHIKNIGYLWNCKNKEEREELVSKLTPVVDRLRYETKISSIYDIEQLENSLKVELEPVRYAINIVTLVLMIISGIAYMSILCFSLKERISEIGIRKAFGASSSDIVFQFFMENLFITIVATLSAVVVSIIVGSLTTSFMKGNFLDDYELNVTWEIIMKPVIFGVIQCFIFTVIPSIRFSVMRVANALRQE